MGMPLVEDLEDLGLASSDTVLVMSDVRFLRIKRTAPGDRINYAEALLDAVSDVVGPEGTVLAMAFTPVSWLPSRRASIPIFSSTALPTTGGFATALMARQGSTRSQHPTNSFVALGPAATELLQFHTPATHCFRPVEELISRGGKMLSIGCVDVAPGFSSTHVAQFHLGLSFQSLLRGRARARYLDEGGRERVFRKRDVPGCSNGFGKMYPRYRKYGILKEGVVSGAPSMLIRADDAYRVDIETLRDDPTIVLCDDPSCVSCKGTLLYAKSSWASCWTSYAWGKTRILRRQD